MKNDEQRILLSKLRISNHNLEIERGRQLYQLFLFWSENNFDTERASDKRMFLLLDKRVK
jgi:hypothetical protein